MSLIPLGELAEIKVGITFRPAESTRATGDGRYHLVRIGDITDEGEIRPDTDFPRLSPAEEVDERMVLRSGDVLFPSKGSRTTAALYHGQPADAVVGSQFFVVRSRDQARLMPAYLAWYFTTAAAQGYFDARRGGSHVQFVSKATLAEFVVPLLKPERQESIALLFAELRRERRLMSLLHEKYRVCIEAGLLQDSEHLPG